MLKAVWAFIVIVNGNVVMSDGSFEERARFSNADACRQNLETHAARVPDFIRGGLNLPWSADIAVIGSCDPVGKDT